ncbi:MAG: hypothetical protein ABIJ30_10120, partial [bacterium]
MDIFPYYYILTLISGNYSAIVILSTFVATQAARIQNSGVRSQNENTCYDSFRRRYGDIER